MKKYNSKFIYCFLLSISVHFTVLMSIFIYFNQLSVINRIKTSYLPAHIEKNMIQGIKSINYNQFESLNKKTSKTESFLNKTLSSSRKTNHFQSTRKQQEYALDRQIIHQTLLKILHDAISAKQIYPESALMLNQHGKVTISLILNPNGLITNVTIIKSSGVSSIDLAALNAIKSVSLPLNVVSGLRKKELFSIDIIFD